MTRDELLDHLRRELDSQKWSELRPDTRLTEVEERVDTLVETLEEIRAAYDDTSGTSLLDALDDLAAALSYFRTDLGHAFSETTRLTNELRTTLRRLESDTPDNQMTIGLAGEESEADEESTDDGEGDGPSQTTLFGE